MGKPEKFIAYGRAGVTMRRILAFIPVFWPVIGKKRQRPAKPQCVSSSCSAAADKLDTVYALMSRYVNDHKVRHPLVTPEVHTVN